MKKEIRYEEKQEIKDALIMCALFLVGLFISCSTTKKTPEQKAYEANQKHIALLKEARSAYPCDTSTIFVTKVDTAYVANGESILYTDSGKIIFRDRIITKVITKQITVVDSAALQLEILNTEQAGYLLQNCQDGANKLAGEIKQKDDIIKKQAEKIKSLSPWKVGVLLFGALFASFGIVLIVLKVKSFFL